MEHYAALGLEPGASQDEIRSAYRRMALKHHPDKCGGDTEMFLKVSQAYQFLSTSREGPSASDAQRFEIINRILRMFMNVAARTCNGPQEPTRVPIRVTLEDIYHHKIKRVAIKRRRPSGWDTKLFYVSLLNYKPCYVFIGEGDESPAGKRSDLVLDLEITEHPEIKVDTVCQFDLYVERKISIYEYYYGTCTNVEHFSGRLSCNKTFEDGSMAHRFVGMGLPKYDESSKTMSRGDLLVFYSLSLPEHSSIDHSKKELMASLFRS